MACFSVDRPMPNASSSSIRMTALSEISAIGRGIAPRSLSSWKSGGSRFEKRTVLP